jgi:TonB family protein
MHKSYFFILGLMLTVLTMGWSQKNRNSSVDLVFEKPEVPAAFPGCTEHLDDQRASCNTINLRNFLAEKLIYPTAAAEKRIEGEVKINVVIDTLGQMGAIRIVKKVDPELDKEALRVVQLLKEEGRIWAPAKMQGRKVASEWTIPVKFLLNKPQVQFQRARNRGTEDN